jgi:4-amino-4-deoxy-L-arabinose transferase-like glycosyltransferase
MTPSDTRTGKPLISLQVERMLLCGILIIALGLRLSHLDSMEFKGDEAFNLLKARELSRGEQFPLTSAKSSTDIPEPPAFMYLLALPILISDDAIFVTASIALINVSAIFLCYLFTRRFFSPLAALVSIALFAVNPWQVLYSRKIWTQNLLPFFALLFLLFFFEALFNKRAKWIIPGLITLSIATQLHLSALFLVPYALVMLLWHRQQVKVRYVLVGGVLGLILWIPYMIYVARNFDHLAQIFLGLGQKAFIFRSSGAILPLQLVSTDGFNDLSVLFQSYEKFASGMINLPLLDYLPRALLVLGILISSLRSSPPQRALAIYVLLGLGYIVLSNSQIFPHYYDAQLPVYFILMALPLAGILQNYRGLPRVATAAILVLLTGYQLLFSVSFLRFIASEDCIWSEYGPPYRVQVERMREIVDALDDQKPAPDLPVIYERVKACVNWDILATEYLYEKLSGKTGEILR